MDKSTGRRGTAVHLFHLIPLAHSMLTQVSLRSHGLGWTLETRQPAKIGELYANAVYSLGKTDIIQMAWGSEVLGNSRDLLRLLEGDRGQPPQLRLMKVGLSRGMVREEYSSKQELCEQKLCEEKHFTGHGR